MLFLSFDPARYNLSVGFPNPEGLLSMYLAREFDWAIAEGCIEKSDWRKGPWYPGKYACDFSNAFLALNKAVFAVVYKKPATIVWPQVGGDASSYVCLPSVALRYAFLSALWPFLLPFGSV